MFRKIIISTQGGEKEIGKKKKHGSSFIQLGLRDTQLAGRVFPDDSDESKPSDSIRDKDGENLPSDAGRTDCGYCEKWIRNGMRTCLYCGSVLLDS